MTLFDLVPFVRHSPRSSRDRLPREADFTRFRQLNFILSSSASAGESLSLFLPDGVDYGDTGRVAVDDGDVADDDVGWM